ACCDYSKANGIGARLSSVTSKLRCTRRARSFCPIWILQERFAGRTANDFAGLVAQADDFVPVVARDGRGINEREERNADAPGPRQDGLIAKKLPRAAQDDGANRALHGDSCLKRAKLERTNTDDARESSFGVDGDGYAVLQRVIHL